MNAPRLSLVAWLALGSLGCVRAPARHTRPPWQIDQCPVGGCTTPAACVEGDERYQEGLEAYAGRRFADAARHFTEAARAWNTAAVDVPDGEVKVAYRRDRWTAYAGATQALLEAGKLDEARGLLRTAQVEAPDLALMLAQAARRLPAPPSCGFEDAAAR